MSPPGVEPGPVVRVTADTSDRSAVIEAIDDAADVSVRRVGPAGTPSPLGLYTTAGRTAIHTDLRPDAAAEAATTLEDGDFPTTGAEAAVDHDEDTAAIPAPDSGPLSVGTRRVLGPCGWVDPTVRPEPVAAEFDPETVLDRVATVGLRGRGRADGATDDLISAVWERTIEAEGDPVVVIHAADTDCPTDELMCRSIPGRVLDGAGIVADAVGAEDVVALATDPAVEPLEAVADGELIHRAPESFRIGEPTMALEALEGNDRIEARRRPPGPEEWGLYGRPTVVHTPRTLVQLRTLLEDGEGFDPESADPGTRTVAVRGAVRAPAVVELRTDSALSRALSAVDAAGDRYVVGGRFGGVTGSVDLPASAPALSASGLGTEGVLEVLGPDDCIVATVGERAAFAREENCGRCVPCREGSKQLHGALRDVYDGEFDPETLRELARVMRTSSLCAFGEAAARPIRTALEAFEPEFRAHAEGRCPAGTCGGLR
ncbi:NADH dehydrogenase FAD-containing subunit [Natronomonas sp. F2-12]|jgi:NADH-quinone oxidoreductase subunit F|uniref:NADH dehydrogenase FAD-containing subunit n=1 Tax=Natronomonas aquatica TaxID=2841590 RepID=A0A9R1CPS3_9EURY|nr:NADH-ubiquinone oxidoreductase-F iron-sulfur binding region domain-containing protein [Natronomonas aquatica]MCQ4332768.1 NADH dehydrogenase FAD-containing subunit [Natronomonas aquatica]